MGRGWWRTACLTEVYQLRFYSELITNVKRPLHYDKRHYDIQGLRTMQATATTLSGQCHHVCSTSSE